MTRRILVLLLLLLWDSDAAEQFPFIFSSLLTSSDSVLQPSPPHSAQRLEVQGLTTLEQLSQLQFSASTKVDDTAIQETAGKSQFGKQELKEQEAMLKASVGTEGATSSPFLSPPTTIKFTLDDVSKFLKPKHPSPQLVIKSAVKLHKDDNTSIATEPLTEESFQIDVISSPPTEQSGRLFIVESGEEEESSKSSRANSSLTVTGQVIPIIQVDGNFKPSLSFPFLKGSTAETLLDERRVTVTSFLQSQPVHYVQSESSTSPVKSFKSVNSANDSTKPQGERYLSKTPVPKIILFNEENQSSEEIVQEEETSTEKNEKRIVEEVDESVKSPLEGHKSSDDILQTEKPLSEEEDGSERVHDQQAEPLSTRKTLHFDQEFLSLLKNHNTREESEDSKVETSSEANIFWFSDRSEGEAVGASWLLKGGARAPLASSTSTEVAATTIKPAQKTNAFMASLRGLMSTTIRNERSTTPSDLEGPKVVPVGEVGEVPHDSSASSAPPLSAAFKHGVQGLNVSTWVSGCPKLYGKVRLNCAANTDAGANAAMSLMWKKKSFSEGRLKEQVVAEGDLLKAEDDRFSLQQSHPGHYDILIKGFLAKDCGTYECEARAADTVVASQLLLFTCL